MFWILKVLPKKILSRIAGLLARVRYPAFLLQSFLKWFISKYKIETSEFKKELKEFDSFSNFFIRELKGGVRPIGPEMVSPVDGTLVSVQPVENGKLLQVKGINYSVKDLLGLETVPENLEGGEVYTLYLAPRDYHRIHSPLESKILERIHIPGTLWPVNDWSIKNIKQVFCVNERVVLRMQAQVGEYFLVMVGATNVGSIGLSFEELRTNKSGQQFSKKSFDDLSVDKGQELGTFYLGSTVVLVFPNGQTRCEKEMGAIKMGEALGAIND